MVRDVNRYHSYQNECEEYVEENSPSVHVHDAGEDFLHCRGEDKLLHQAHGSSTTKEAKVRWKLIL